MARSGKAWSIYEIGTIDSPERICSLLFASHSRALFVSIAGGQERPFPRGRQKAATEQRCSARHFAASKRRPGNAEESGSQLSARLGLFGCRRFAQWGGRTTLIGTLGPYSSPGGVGTATTPFDAGPSPYSMTLDQVFTDGGSGSDVVFSGDGAVSGGVPEPGTVLLSSFKSGTTEFSCQRSCGASLPGCPATVTTSPLAICRN